MTDKTLHTTDVPRIREGAERFPLMVVAAVSYVCNARCPNCPYTQSDIRETYRDTPFMKPETFKRIADECGKHGAWLRLTGGGEPLLHPQMLDLIQYAKWVGAKTGLITNGSMLTSETSAKLLSLGVDAIEISVDAADKLTYGIVRPGLDFNRLCANVGELLYRRYREGYATKIIASVIDQRAIADKLDSVVRFWENRVDNVQVRKFLTWGIGDESQSANPIPYITDHHTPCPFPFERLNMDSRGKIEFCGFDIRGETDFGNVHEMSIEEVWQGEKFNRWRRLLLDGRYGEISVCVKCPDWRYRSWEHNYWKVLKGAEKHG